MSLVMAAVLFFLVTMGLAVGPLLLCRVFAGPSSRKCPPQPRRSSLTSGVLTFCGVALGLGALLLTYFFAMRPSSDATAAGVVHLDHGSVDDLLVPQFSGPVPHFSGPVPHEIAPGEVHLPPGYDPHLPVQVVEHSMFLEPPVPAVPRPAISRSDLLEFGSMGMTCLLLFAVACAVLSERVRTFLARAAPVVLAVALVGVLFFWSFNRSASPVVEDAVVVASPPPLAVTTLLPPGLGEPWQQSPATTRSDHSAKQPANTSIMVEKQQRIPIDSSTPQAADPEPAAPPVLAYVGTSAAGAPREALPKWVDDAGATGTVRVIDSGMHATVKLAEEHALQELKTLLRSEMVRHEPQAAGWQPADQVVLNGGNILQRAVARTQIEVGDNTIPMYEAYWQVDLGRLEPLYQAWRPSVVQQRLLQIGGGVALLMLLLGTIAGVLRVDEQTEGQRRKSLAAGTLALWAFVAGIALFVA